MAKALKVLLPLSAIVFLMALDSCGIRRAGSFVSITDGKWPATEILEIRCDSGSAEDKVAVALRFNDLYPFKAITMEVIVEDATGNNRGETTVTIDLYDKNGKRLGRGIGSSYQIEKITDLHFPEDSCMVKVRHLMDTPTIEGIEMIGILSVNE